MGLGAVMQSGEEWGGATKGMCTGGVLLHS